MPTEAKKATVAALKEELSAAKATIVADYRGLTVADIGAVRRSLRGEGIQYRVVKNRLAKIAAQEAGNTELAELLSGPSALAMSGGDEAALAKSFLDAIRPYRSVAIRGAVLGGQRVDADGVTRLATLPSREVLLGKLAGGMVAPISTMASLFAAPLRNLGYALSQLVAQKEAAAPAEAAKPEAQAEAATAEAVAEAPAEAPAEAAAEAENPAEAEATAEAPAAEATAAADETATDETATDEAAADESATADEASAAEASADTTDEPTADAEPAADTDTTDAKE
jgi:large subunit ribosomal protein L10